MPESLRAYNIGVGNKQTESTYKRGDNSLSKKTLKVEVWDFWELFERLDSTLNTAKMLDMDIKMVYHANQKAAELWKMAILEQALRTTGQKYEMSIVFDKEEAGCSTAEHRKTYVTEQKAAAYDS